MRMSLVVGPRFCVVVRSYLYVKEYIIQHTRIPSIDPMLIIREGEEGVALAVNNGKHLESSIMNHPLSFCLHLTCTYACDKEKIRFKFKLITFSKAASG